MMQKQALAETEVDPQTKQQMESLLQLCLVYVIKHIIEHKYLFIEHLEI